MSDFKKAVKDISEWAIITDMLTNDDSFISDTIKLRAQLKIQTERVEGLRKVVYLYSQASGNGDVKWSGTSAQKALANDDELKAKLSEPKINL